MYSHAKCSRISMIILYMIIKIYVEGTWICCIKQEANYTEWKRFALSRTSFIALFIKASLCILHVMSYRRTVLAALNKKETHFLPLLLRVTLPVSNSPVVVSMVKYSLHSPSMNWWNTKVYRDKRHWVVTIRKKGLTNKVASVIKSNVHGDIQLRS